MKTFDRTDQWPKLLKDATHSFYSIKKKPDMTEQAYLTDCQLQLRKLKDQADRALSQLKNEHLFVTLDPEANSIAIIMKHMAGNMRSRWTNFLTTDGEKPERNRDSEFELQASDNRESIFASWEDGWKRVFGSIETLQPQDVGRTVTVRGEEHSVLEAINRQMTHYAMHVGQIVFLAKHYAGVNWQSLSIPKGKSKEFDVKKGGERFKL